MRLSFEGFQKRTLVEGFTEQIRIIYTYYTAKVQTLFGTPDAVIAFPGNQSI